MTGRNPEIVVAGEKMPRTHHAIGFFGGGAACYNRDTASWIGFRLNRMGNIGEE